MAISQERLAEIQRMAEQRKTAPTSGSQGISPERMAEIQNLVQQRTAAPQVAQPQEKKQNIISAIGKPFGKIIATAGAIGEGTADLLRGDVSGAQEALTRQRKTGLGEFRPVGINEQGEEKSFGGQVADVIGTGIGAGSFAAPGAIGLGGGIRALAKGGAVAGFLGSGGEALQEQKPLGQGIASTIGGTLGGAALGAALPGLGKIASKTVGRVGRGTGKVGAEVLGKTTGTGAAAIEEAFSNPNVIKYARQAGKEGPESLLNQALDEARAGLSKIQSNRSDDYLAQLRAITANKKPLTSVANSIKENARNMLDNFNVSIGDEGLDFSNSTITRNQRTLAKAFNDIISWEDASAEGLDTLKKRLTQYVNEIPSTEKGGAYNLLLNMKNEVSDALKNNVEGYAEMTKGYQQATELIEEIQRALSLRNKKTKDTAVRKLMSTMRQNNELRKEMLSTLGQEAGADITGKIAGATLAPALPRGLAGAVQPTLSGFGGATVLVNPSTLPAFLMYLATSSPRLMAEAINILSKAGSSLNSPQTQNALKNLLIQAQKEIGDTNGASKALDQAR